MNKNKKKKRRKWVALLAFPIAALAIHLSGKDDCTEVNVYEAHTGSIVESIPSSGKVRPVVEVVIAPDVSGEIVEICRKEGDHVAKGDVVLRIKQDLYISLVEQAEASLGTLKAQYNRQEAELSLAQQNFDRARELFAKEALSKEDFERTEAELRIAKESLEAAGYSVKSGEAALREANENLVKTTILSPIDGTVSAMNVEEGERVVGTSQMAGTEMFRVADLSCMEIMVNVSENDIVRISLSDSVRIEIDAYPHAQFSGKVTHIANSAKNIGSLFDQVANFEVRIEIDPGKERLLPGMSASVSIVTEKSEDNILLPLSSVFSVNKREYVWVVAEDWTVSRAKVTTGIQDLKSVEILEGLEVGEMVVTSPSSAISGDLHDGDKVRIATIQEYEQ